jgi:hypothetical protein
VALQRHREETSAVRAALDLLALPSRRRYFRQRPLPADIGLLLQIVVDDQHAIKSSAEHAQASPARLRQAAEFYIQQIMLAPQSDSYRILGSRRGATAAELRQNLSYLCRWLHSDGCENTMQSVFLLRVTQAWNDLKTPDRRNAYDAELDARSFAPKVSRRSRVRRNIRILLPLGDSSGGAKRGWVTDRAPISLWRLVSFMFGSR